MIDAIECNAIYFMLQLILEYFTFFESVLSFANEFYIYLTLMHFLLFYVHITKCLTNKGTKHIQNAIFYMLQGNQWSGNSMKRNYKINSCHVLQLLKTN